MRRGIWDCCIILWPFFAHSNMTLGDVIFPTSQNNTQQCIDQPVEYQCTVTGSGFVYVVWEILRDDGTRFDKVVTYLSNTNEDPDTIGGVFTVERLPGLPLTSNISFTIQSSINEYTIVCKNGITRVSKSLTIQAPNNPDDVIIHTDTFTDLSVDISWTESPPYCGTTYRYNVSSTAPGWVNIIMESTSNSVTVEGLVPSDDQYCVVVTAFDRYSTRNSDNKCFSFNVPAQVEDIAVSFTMDDVASTNITVNWSGILTHKSNITAVDCPVLSGYAITITGVHSTDQYTVMGTSDLLLPPNTTEYTFPGYPAASGINYTISITAINGVGNSIPTIAFIEVPFPIPDVTVRTNCSAIVHDNSLQSSALKSLLPSTQASSTSQVSLIPYTDCPKQVKLTTFTSVLFSSDVLLVQSTPFIIPTTLTEYTADRQEVGIFDSSATVAGISVAITVPITAVITAIITVIILYLCGCIRLNKRSDRHRSSATTNGRLSRQESINAYSRPPSGVLINSLITDEDNDLPVISHSKNTAYGQVKSTYIEGISSLRHTRTESPTVLMNTSHRMSHHHQTTEPTACCVDGELQLGLETNVAYGQTTVNGYRSPPQHYEIPLSQANGRVGSRHIPCGLPSNRIGDDDDMITNGVYAEVIPNYNINTTDSSGTTINDDNGGEGNTEVYYDTIPGSKPLD